MRQRSWIRCSKKENRPFTLREKVSSSTVAFAHNSLEIECKKKSVKSYDFTDFFCFFVSFLVEISGIEPLTS